MSFRRQPMYAQQPAAPRGPYGPGPTQPMMASSPSAGANPYGPRVMTGAAFPARGPMQAAGYAGAVPGPHAGFPGQAMAPAGARGPPGPFPGPVNAGFHPPVIGRGTPMMAGSGPQSIPRTPSGGAAVVGVGPHTPGRGPPPPGYPSPSSPGLAGSTSMPRKGSMSGMPQNRPPVSYSVPQQQQAQPQSQPPYGGGQFPVRGVGTGAPGRSPINTTGTAARRPSQQYLMEGAMAQPSPTTSVGSGVFPVQLQSSSLQKDRSGGSDSFVSVKSNTSASAGASSNLSAVAAQARLGIRMQSPGLEKEGSGSSMGSRQAGSFRSATKPVSPVAPPPPPPSANIGSVPTAPLHSALKKPPPGAVMTPTGATPTSGGFLAPKPAKTAGFKDIPMYDASPRSDHSHDSDDDSKEKQLDTKPFGGKGVSIAERAKSPEAAPVNKEPAPEVALKVLALIKKKWAELSTDSTDVTFKWSETEAADLFTLLLELIEVVKPILEKQSYPYLKLKSPVCVLGDLHGRFADLAFFLKECYLDEDEAEPAAPNPGSSAAMLSKMRSSSPTRPKKLKISSNALLLSTKGEWEFAPVTELPDAMTKSSANLKRCQSEAPVSYKRKRYSTRNLLFLGDYVDRGGNSVEVIAYLLALFARSPDEVHLLRGNHETIEMNMNYGFKAECDKLFGAKPGQQFYSKINVLFHRLPLSANIDGQIFCAHGGVPRPGPNGIEDRIALLESADCWGCFRDGTHFTKPQTSVAFRRCKELFEDLLWADPAEPSEESTLDAHGFGKSKRGGGCLYGQKGVELFLEKNDFELILRAHQPKSSGFQISKGGKVITIFSSSNYMADTDNSSGVLFVGNGTVRAITRVAGGPDDDEEDEED